MKEKIQDMREVVTNNSIKFYYLRVLFKRSIIIWILWSVGIFFIWQCLSQDKYKPYFDRSICSVTPLRYNYNVFAIDAMNQGYFPFFILDNSNLRPAEIYWDDQGMQVCLNFFFFIKKNVFGVDKISTDDLLFLYKCIILFAIIAPSLLWANKFFSLIPLASYFYLLYVIPSYNRAFPHPFNISNDIPLNYRVTDAVPKITSTAYFQFHPLFLSPHYQLIIYSLTSFILFYLIIYACSTGIRETRPFVFLMKFLPFSFLATIIVGFRQDAGIMLQVGITLYILVFIFTNLYRNKFNRISFLKNISFALLLILISFSYPSVLSGIIKYRNIKYPDTQKIDVAKRQHGFAHPLYVGLGFVENKYSIRFEDNVVYTHVKKLKPDIDVGTTEYQKLVKKMFLDIIIEEPSLFFKNMWRKLIHINHILCSFYAYNVVFLCSLFIPIFFLKNFTISSLTLLAFYGVVHFPALLAIPDLNYMTGIIVFHHLCLLYFFMNVCVIFVSKVFYKKNEIEAINNVL